MKIFIQFKVNLMHIGAQSPMREVKAINNLSVGNGWQSQEFILVEI